MSRLECDIVQRLEDLFHGIASRAFKRSDQFLIQLDHRIRTEIRTSDAQEIGKRCMFGACWQFSNLAIGPMTLTIVTRHISCRMHVVYHPVEMRYFAWLDWHIVNHLQRFL